MKKIWFLLSLTILTASAPQPPPLWERPQVERLLEWMKTANSEALTTSKTEIPALEEALRIGDPRIVDERATRDAVILLKAYRDGCCNAALRKGWHIADNRVWPDATGAVRNAVARDELDDLFNAARPSHPYYSDLAKAFAKERDPGRRAVIAANIDRWRWMPRELGPRYLLVNAASFEAALWVDGRLAGRWSVIVGKTGSPTPVFQATVTAVTFNPWWEIPPRIASEGVAGLMARHPSEASRRGYVRSGGRYRQRPGPGNALGQMKLVMPNPYNVYLHDTPSKALFDKDVRTFSHGCVRVNDAIGLATVLLADQRNWTREDSNAIVASKRTITTALVRPIPVYVVYFTAEPDGLGDVRYFPDVYHRDKGASAPGENGQCAA